MGMQVDGDGDVLFQFGDEFGDIERRHDAGHILQTEGVRPHILNFFGFIEIIV